MLRYIQTTNISTYPHFGSDSVTQIHFISVLLWELALCAGSMEIHTWQLMYISAFSQKICFKTKRALNHEVYFCLGSDIV